jgi:hypothetical protein
MRIWCEKSTKRIIVIDNNVTWSLSQSSTELQDVSSKGTLGSKSSLALTVEEDEVRTTRLKDGFFLHERSTFNVPSIAGSKISACCRARVRKTEKGYEYFQVP